MQMERQKVYTQIRLLPVGAVWSASAQFAQTCFKIFHCSGKFKVSQYVG